MTDLPEKIMMAEPRTDIKVKMKRWTEIELPVLNLTVRDLQDFLWILETEDIANDTPVTIQASWGGLDEVNNENPMFTLKVTKKSPLTEDTHD